MTLRPGSLEQRCEDVIDVSFGFDPERPRATLSSGPRVTLRERGDATSVVVPTPGDDVVVAEVSEKTARIFGSPGGKVPLYARYSAGRWAFHNVGAELLAAGETASLVAEAVLQHIGGASGPLDNLFHDLESIEASSIYRVEGQRLVYAGSKVAPSPDVPSFDFAFERLMDVWNRQTASGDLLVLLTGGFDSRLNLALALRAASRSGVRVRAYHEEGHALDAQLARQLADVAGVALDVRVRRSLLPPDRPVEFHWPFLRMHSGTYRNSLLVWNRRLPELAQEYAGCSVVGFGAEAHKGKYYGLIHRLPEDVERVFGSRTDLIRELARGLGLASPSSERRRTYFRQLTQRAEVFEALDARIDFCHYQTYVGNAYGKRSHALWQLYGVQFPFLDEEFLRRIFSLPRSEKERFAVTRSALRRLAPELLSVPFKSGNTKALRSKSSDPVARALRELLRFVTGRRGARRKTASERAGLHASELAVAASLRPRSEITRALAHHAASGFRDLAGAHVDYAFQMLLYLCELEKRHAIEFRLI
jgi:hypothetical protein